MVLLRVIRVLFTYIRGELRKYNSCIHIGYEDTFEWDTT